MISYVIVLVYVLYMIFKSYRASIAKKQVGTVALVGCSDYQKIFITLLNLFFLPFIVTLDSHWKYAVYSSLFSCQPCWIVRMLEITALR